MKNRPVFDSYARYYDIMYRDKAYRPEAEYVLGLVRRHAKSASHLLELGCGTGAHAESLVDLGCKVFGIDRSTEMLVRAEERKRRLPHGKADRLTFREGDIRSFRCGVRFDAVLSLFHVISYQTTDSDILAAFKTAKEHLKPGGVFLFDCWYGPAVLTDRPIVREKRMEDERTEVFRVATPVMVPRENIVEVNYHVCIRDKSTKAEGELEEIHRMRYLFTPEVEELLRQSGFDLIESHKWMSEKEPGFDSWYAVFVAKFVVAP